MKRLHVGVGVSDLEASVKFYSELFGAAPSVQKTDYAKWLLDDPRVNFSISSRDDSKGVNHLGIEAGDDAELAQVRARLDAAEGPVLDVGKTTCCYARSDKSWIRDPDGVPWEAFHTFGHSDTFGDEGDLARLPALETEKCC